MNDAADDDMMETLRRLLAGAPPEVAEKSADLVRRRLPEDRSPGTPPSQVDADAVDDADEPEDRGGT
jgi:hypothetical protein